MQPPAVQAQARLRRCSSVGSPGFSWHSCDSLQFRVLLPENSSREVPLPTSAVVAPVLRSYRNPWKYLPAEDGIDIGARVSKTNDHSALLSGSLLQLWRNVIRPNEESPSAKPCEILPEIQHPFPLLRFLATDGQELGGPAV